MEEDTRIISAFVNTERGDGVQPPEEETEQAPADEPSEDSDAEQDPFYDEDTRGGYGEGGLG